jgi:hypothetical protein
MFQLTPQYPAGFARWAPIVLLGVLAVWSAQLLETGADWIAMVWLAGLAVAAAYAAVTLWLQQRRRRHIADPTFHCFRGAMICLLATFVSGVVMVLVPALGDEPATAWWLGVLVIAGAFVSLINGMAYKIVPFLCWLHLQRMAGIGGAVPNMREIAPERAQTLQLRLHFASVALLLLATFRAEAMVPAGLAFATSNAWLGWNLIGAVRRYRGFRDRGCAGAASRER